MLTLVLCASRGCAGCLQTMTQQIANSRVGLLSAIIRNFTPQAFCLPASSSTDLVVDISLRRIPRDHLPQLVERHYSHEQWRKPWLRPRDGTDRTPLLRCSGYCMAPPVVS